MVHNDETSRESDGVNSEVTTNATTSPLSDDEDMLLTTPASTSGGIKVATILQNITVEPLMFLHMFGMTSSSVVIQNLYIDRICSNVLNYSEDICFNLTNASFHDQETKVDEIAASYTLYRNLIESGLPILVSLFLGPWSDKHGTKFPLIFPLFGYICSCSIFFTLSFYPQLSPSILLFASVPIALTGGMVSLVLSAFSFMAARTTIKERSIRIALVENAWFLASPIGLYSSAKILNGLGYSGAFLISGSSYTLALIYGVLAIREAKKEVSAADLEERKESWVVITAIKDVRETFITCFRPRDGPFRRWIFLLFFAVCLRIFTLFGLLNITFLYTRNKFNWDAGAYAQYSTIDSTMNIIGGNLAAIVFMFILKIDDVKIGIGSALGYTIASLVYAFASASWMMYLGAVLQMFCGLITILIRSLLSKSVSKGELGKVFSLLASFEAAMPIIAAPIYVALFRTTVHSFPGAVFLLSAFLNSLIFFIFLYFIFSLRRHQNLHQELQNSLQ